MLYHFLLTDNEKKNKAEILLLSVAANIVSRHTSMVGVDKDRKEMVVGEMIQRKVPLMTSPGFPGSFQTYGEICRGEYHVSYSRKTILLAANVFVAKMSVFSNILFVKRPPEACFISIILLA